MALMFFDRVKETSTTTGTGTYTLAGAATGFRTFTSVLANGESCTYCAEDGTDWEVNEGVFTTSGTTLSRATVIASSNAGAAVSWGAGTRNIFLTQSARDVEPSPWLPAGGTTGCLAATYDRVITPNSVALTAATSGTLRMYLIRLRKGLPVTNISFWSGTTAGATLTHQWFALFDINRVVLAKTADDTNVAWAASAKKTLAVTSGPYIIPSAGLYYIGLLVTATTVPNIEGASAVNATGARNTAPLTGGNSTTGLTDPASCTGTQTAITVIVQHSYAEIS